jgi:hypothetical protein
MTTLKEMVYELGRERHIQDGNKSAMKALKDEFDKVNAQLIEEIKVEAKRVDDMEKLIREEAIKIFLTDQSTKQLEGGVKIQEGREFDFKNDEAIEWSIYNAKIFITLDTKAFIKFLRITDTMPNIVKERKVINATIPMDIPDTPPE